MEPDHLPAVYFSAPDDMVYRVLDATMRAVALIVFNPPSPGAMYRVFRPKAGHRRLYRFAEGESREPTEAHLERQLRVAEYLPSQRYAPSDQDPR